MPISSVEVAAVLERLEAEQINLGLYNTRVGVAELCAACQSGAAEDGLEDDVAGIVARLVADGEVVEWEPGHFRSRIAETVRVIRLLRQRLWQQSFGDAPLLVEDVRVEFRARRRPKRDAVLLRDAIPAEVPSDIVTAFAQAVPMRTLSWFQAEAIRQLFACSRAFNPNNESFVVAGDTGAGKTEAFLFPILLDIASEGEELRRRPGVRAVLVYPRIRLARNQLGRILRYTGRLADAGGPLLGVGIQNGDVPANRAAMNSWERKVRTGRAWLRVPLLETCLGCGAGAYWVAEDDGALDDGCPALVCDACGHEIRNLRLTQAALAKGAPNLLLITDVSLHQWLARERYAHLWGLWHGDVQTEAPRYLVLDEVHLYEQIRGAHLARLIKRFQARVRMVYKQRDQPLRHPVVVGVSATLHDERRFLAKLMDVAPADEELYQRLRVIKPAPEDLELTNGRERYIFIYPRSLSPTPSNPEFRVTDQTAAIQIIMAAMHNLKTQQEWRGLAFFDSLNDLRQFRYNYDDPQFNGQGQPPANQQELWRIRTDIQERRGGLSPTPGPTRPNCGGTCEQRAGANTLQQCPHFQNGDCWIFARMHGWNRALSVADTVYAGSAAALDGRDLIPTSPSLEVGYDDDAIQLVYQHKAPPSAASFIQRRGRAGRDPNDSPIIITLLWPHRRNDGFYFYHPEALYDPTFDDVPLNPGNFNVQRTHALLAFFDLLACLRRQNLDGIAEDPQIPDFTLAGSSHFPLDDKVVQDFQRRNHPQKGLQIVLKRRADKESVWFSGGHFTNGHVEDHGSHIAARGWLLLQHRLAVNVLARAWERLRKVFAVYAEQSKIWSTPFEFHSSNPFLIPPGGSVPTALLSTFGNPDWHSVSDKGESGNWLKTYRKIDWMLQGSEEATTLTLHYPNPNQAAVSQGEAPAELTVNVTFGLMEMLPGNVSYRLRENGAIHWTPVPPEGEPTFLLPEEPVEDDEGEVVGRRPVPAFLPQFREIAAQRDSIFGVPRHLAERFPDLRFLEFRRLRVETFGRPNEQVSRLWRLDRAAGDPTDFRAAVVPPGSALPQGTELSRRSSASASSAIVPYVAAARRIQQRQLTRPLNALFGTIDGYLEEGGAMLGYTRVYYEMRISLRQPGQPEIPLTRSFYPPDPERDDSGNPRPVLVGYSVETQGICFEVNPALIRDAVAAVLRDESLRLDFRGRFVQYRMAAHARALGIYSATLLDLARVAVEYWLRSVVPQSAGVPRLFDARADREPLLAYLASNRNVNQVEIGQRRVDLTDGFFDRLNREIEAAFRDTREFYDFMESVLLHSLSTTLKNLMARLGGVSSEDLIAYTDMPVLEQVDRSTQPRVIIMDTVEGGSGAIAQAFERLDLSDNAGSLWWLLQEELGACPMADGEALIRTVLTRATEDQIRQVQAEASPEALGRLLDELDLTPSVDARQALGRLLFNEVRAGAVINPALLLRELFALHASLEQQGLGPLAREATIRTAVTRPAPDVRPRVAEFAEELRRNQAQTTGADPAHELAVQATALFQSSCEDGCPVCIGSGSDIDNYHTAHLLNSRRVLGKLWECLFANIPTGDSLAALAASLREGEPVRVEANPGSFANRYSPELGLGVVARADATGQIRDGVAIPSNLENAEGLLSTRDGWKKYMSPPTIEVRPDLFVRSRAEFIIATWLDQQGIAFEYESPLPYREDGETYYIHPDFFLYESGVYVEYWGRDDTAYLVSRRFKERVYAARKIEVVSIEKDEVDNGVFKTKIGRRLYDSS